MLEAFAGVRPWAMSTVRTVLGDSSGRSGRRGTGGGFGRGGVDVGLRWRGVGMRPVVRKRGLGEMSWVGLRWRGVGDAGLRPAVRKRGVGEMSWVGCVSRWRVRVQDLCRLERWGDSSMGVSLATDASRPGVRIGFRGGLIPGRGSVLQFPSLNFRSKGMYGKER